MTNASDIRIYQLKFKDSSGIYLLNIVQEKFLISNKQTIILKKFSTPSYTAILENKLTGDPLIDSTNNLAYN